MKFSSKQVVTMVVAVALGVGLIPIGAMAATGQLVNIVDPVLSGRQVRVGSGGSLQVETRPGVTSSASNVNHVDIASLSPRPLLEVVSPNRAALSEFSATVRKFGSPVNAVTIVELVRYAHVSGVNPCGGTGWTGTVLRRFAVHTDQMIHIKFDGPPLIVAPGASGQRVCLAVKLFQWVGDTRVDAGATVFTYN